jgi:CubicO group peptidase (beta-lactamase class C family)
MRYIALAISLLLIAGAGFSQSTTDLTRSTPAAEKVNAAGITAYAKAVKESGLQLHSYMVLRHGKVIAADWLGDHSATEEHVMYSVSKTFTSTAIGFAVTEGLLKISDKVISFFPNDLPDTVTPYLRELTVRDLLIMSCGHGEDPSAQIRKHEGSWVKQFLAYPIAFKPGTHFQYNSVGTYMLSAIVQKLTGKKVVDYLTPRLFQPLGISGYHWEESPQGINAGGWGLYLKTEDLAKMGQFMLQKGKWQGKQLLPAAWFAEATKLQTPHWPQSWVKPGQVKENSDWMQGYGYQIWRCRHNAFRADGKDGQFVVVIPDKDAVVINTAFIQDTQAELNLIWDYLLPAME